MGVIGYIETVVVAMSLMVAVGYHVILWHCFIHCPSRTSIGINALQRRSWLREGDDQTAILAVQSLRNTKMVAILTASIAMLVYVSLAAATNNAFTGSHLFTSAVFGSHNPTVFVLKYGSTSLLLAASFFCSSVGVGYLVDANFLIDTGECSEMMRLVMERGFLMATVGNRVMCVSIPLLLWMFGPLPVAVSSLCLVSLLYHFDFPSSSHLIHL